jgi:hypothetical protein
MCFHDMPPVAAQMRATRLLLTLMRSPEVQQQLEAAGAVPAVIRLAGSPSQVLQVGGTVALQTRGVARRSAAARASHSLAPMHRQGHARLQLCRWRR